MKKFRLPYAVLCGLSFFWLCCTPGQQQEQRVVIWHQMRPDERSILQRQIGRYKAEHPGVEIVEVYKETEDVRSSYIIAAIAGQGPDLVYGPSDAVGIFEATKTIQPLETLFSPAFISDFDSSGLLYYQGHLYQIADKIGNHLALVYNKKYVRVPPTTDEELIRMATGIEQQYGYTAGRPNVYGLAWNYTEPFFFIPFLTGFGGWVFETDGTTPSLSSASMISALRFVLDLRDKYKIIPSEADYETADALFKDGKSAMLINGDWSWAAYAQRMDIGVAPLPRIVTSGLWCSPMTSPKGFSMNVNVKGPKLTLVKDVLTSLLSEQSQLEFTHELMTAPTRTLLYQRPEIISNDILRNSLLQIRLGRSMPVVPEMRAVWDGMRPAYQAVMGGKSDPETAARQMQQLALRKIRDMKE
jgi:maltose-binding protein MalE